MQLLRLSLMLVVFVDVMGQGLILPIINTLLIDPKSTFLPASMEHGTREIYYGVLMATFYIFWFFGAAYISKLSDYIGRKNGMVICLVGALLGYIMTIIAIEMSNFYLLLLGRAISGFTAGNQPIAQAALVDISHDDAERTENMGRVVAALALGLVAGPLISGILSDSDIIGGYASLELPFWVATLLVFITLMMVQFFYSDTRTERKKIDFGVSEVFVNLLRIRNRPTIIKLAIVWFFAELGLNAFFVYVNNYTITVFDFSTFDNSLLMIVFGLVMAFSSGFLASRLTTRYRKVPTTAAAVALMMVSLAAFTVNTSSALVFVLLIPIILGFGIAYPTMLALFSASAGKDEQGWVMGVTIALFTLGTGMMSLVGGAMMAVDARLPFITGIVAYAIALYFILTLWRQEDVQALDPKPKVAA